MNVAFILVAKDLHAPWIAADFAILDEGAGDVRFDVDLDVLAAVRTGHRPRIVQALSAARMRCGFNGTRRMRTPVASKIAFATAAIIGLHAASPAP